MMNTPEPFELIVRRHGPTVLRVCRAVLGPGADAEDAWSETFLAALRAWPERDEVVHPEAWLVRVAHRKAVDVLRARSRRPTLLPGSAGSPSVERPSPLGNPDAEAVDLWRAVGQLPDRQRAAVAYHFLGGLSHVQTAEVIGGTPDAVRRAAADGLATLRRRYAAGPPTAGVPGRTEVPAQTGVPGQNLSRKEPNDDSDAPR